MCNSPFRLLFTSLLICSMSGCAGISALRSLSGAGTHPAPPPTAGAAAEAPLQNVSALPSAGAAECSGLKDRREDIDFNDLLRTDGEMVPNVRERRRKLLAEATRADFVAAAADITSNDIGMGGRAQNPTLLYKKGEPLLKLTCSTRYSTFAVMGLGLHHENSVPAQLIDPAPGAFVLPATPPLWDFDERKAYVFASPEDMAAVPTAATAKKYAEACADKALDACAAASVKVKNGPWRPDLQERADEACASAKSRELDVCMGTKNGKLYGESAKKLDDLRRTRDVASFEQLKAKFGTK